MAKATTIVPPPYRNITNGGMQGLPRPDSRASTIHDRRSVTPQRRVQSQASSGRSDTPPQKSVWDSMHAPTNANDAYQRPAPAKSMRGRYTDVGPITPKAPRGYRLATPSPTPSTVSLAPTQGSDGWWS